jgi:hypothetical protein
VKFLRRKPDPLRASSVREDVKELEAVMKEHMGVVDQQVKRLLFRLEAEEAVIKLSSAEAGYGEVVIREKQ